MTEQLSLWSQDSEPERVQKGVEPAQPVLKAETDLYPTLEQDVAFVLAWAKKHHWWELCYVGYDGQRGTVERIGPGKAKWDEFAAHPGRYDARKAAIFARQWERLETQPGAFAGEFLVEVPAGLHLVDLHWGRKRLLELGEQCEYWPIHWRVNGIHQALQVGRPCWHHQGMMATTEWLTNAIRAVELYIELSQTSIICASCKKPLYFPGYTLEQVRERFKDSRCGMCLNRMFAVEVQS